MNEVAEKQEIATVEPNVREAATNIIQVIERAALNPDIDVEKMERLLSMQERILAREAEGEFNRAMRAAQAEMPEVVRDAKNDTTHSRYATLEAINEVITPVITKHGFSMSFGTADCPLQNHYRVTCVVSHEDGHSREYHADVPTDMTGMKGNQNKTATHGFGSTMSYGRRYLTVLIFNISLTDEDDDGQAAGAGEKVSEDQLAELLALADEVGADKQKFCAWAGVESFADIAAAKFEQAKDALEQKRKTASAEAQ